MSFSLISQCGLSQNPRRSHIISTLTYELVRFLRDDNYIDEFLDDFELSREQFYEIVDKFANHDLFKKDANGKLYRDNDGNIELLYHP